MYYRAFVFLFTCGFSNVQLYKLLSACSKQTITFEEMKYNQKTIVSKCVNESILIVAYKHKQQYNFTQSNCHKLNRVKCCS